MKTWSKYEKYEKVWNLWKEEEFGIFVTWEWGHCVLCTLCSLERPWCIFLVKSCQLPISPRPFIGICVFVGRCFTTCLHFWLGHTTPYSPKVANHFVSCAQVHQVNVVLFDCITFLGTCILHGRKRNISA